MPIEVALTARVTGEDGVYPQRFMLFAVAVLLLQAT